MKEVTNIEEHIDKIFKTNRFEDIQKIFNSGVLHNLENDRLKNLLENREFNFIEKLLKSLINYPNHFSDLLYSFADKIVKIDSGSLRFQFDEILKEGDEELNLYLISGMLTDLKEEDLFFLFENSDYDLFEIIMKMSKFVNINIDMSMDIQTSAENLEYLFKNLGFKIREIIKKKIIKYFQKEDFEALTLMVNVGLLDYFTINEYISLIEDTECDLVKILVLSLIVPYWRIIDSRYVIFEIFKKIENKEENIKKKLKNEIFRLFSESPKWILVELIMDKFFKYLDKEHIEVLFRDSNTKLKTNFYEILREENKDKEFGFGGYIERIADFLIKINKELGKAFLLDIIYKLPNESKNMLYKDLKGWIDYPDANLDDLIQAVIDGE